MPISPETASLQKKRGPRKRGGGRAELLALPFVPNHVLFTSFVNATFLVALAEAAWREHRPRGPGRVESSAFAVFARLARHELQLAAISRDRRALAAAANRGDLEPPRDEGLKRLTVTQWWHTTDREPRRRADEIGVRFLDWSANVGRDELSSAAARSAVRCTDGMDSSAATTYPPCP